MGLSIYNTLSRKKEAFEPLEPGKVRMYVCGPTVYDRSHIGHAMSAVVFDVIRRYLEYKGYQVTHVRNYTDVDDKVIQRANELGVVPMELAEKYISEYDHHAKDLNTLPATVSPRASEEIDYIVGIVEQLINSGHAYEVGGDVYFRVAKDEEYGKLSRRKLEDMRAGFRIEVDERKEDPADFALWKSAKPGEPSWESPWGAGRPGWHIECSAMSLRYLGEEIDIHGGGNDLIFPHHENEIAQSESLTGKSFARYWVHNGMVQLSGEAMSKSVGNVVSVEEFLKQYGSDVMRMMVLGSHYRGPLTFKQEVIDQARRSLERMQGAFRPANSSAEGDPAAEKSLAAKVDEVCQGFEAAMDDDFNTPGALGQLFELVRAINQGRDAGVAQEGLAAAQEALRGMTSVLGLRLTKTEELLEATPFIELLLHIRRRLREEKQWKLADLIRDGLGELGIQLEDGKEGTDWRVG